MYQIGDWQLRWLGHDGYQLKSDKLIIYIDPYKVEGGSKADYILITHEHYDHFDRESIDRLRNINTVILGPKVVTDQFNEMAIPLEPGEHYDANAFQVLTTIAYNTDKKFHPKEDEKLGYILEIAGKRLYHAGDTDVIPEMSQLGKIDVALIPVSGTYVMTAEQAAEAIDLIKPQLAIPMHYGAIIGTEDDAKRFKELVGERCQVEILEPEPAL